MNEYKNSFGNNNEFWSGLDNLHSKCGILD